MKSIKCPLCNGSDFKGIIQAKDYRVPSDNTYQIVKCKNCSLIFLNPRPNLGELIIHYEKLYEKEHSFQYKLIQSAINQLRIKKLINLKRGDGRALDVGCGAGDFIYLLAHLSNFKEIYGIEPDFNAYNQARLKLDRYKPRVHIYNKSLEESKFPDEYFDVITLWHVFEHLANPNSALIEIRRILKKDGYLIVEVPNIGNPLFKVFKERYYPLDIPRHMFFYDKNTLRRILEKNGFIIIEQRFPYFESPEFIFGSILNLVGPSKQKLKYMFSLMVSIPPFFLGKIMQLIYSDMAGSIYVLAKKQ